MRLVRWLAWSVGLLFLVGTVIQLVDVSNLYTKPPDIPESLNMVGIARRPDSTLRSGRSSC